MDSSMNETFRNAIVSLRIILAYCLSLCTNSHSFLFSYTSLETRNQSKNKKDASFIKRFSFQGFLTLEKIIWLVGGRKPCCFSLIWKVFWMLSYLFTHYMVNTMICRVWVTFCGKGKWPLRTNGKDFPYFRIQLLVLSGIMPYLLLCCIVDIYCSTCFIYDNIYLIICLY